MLQKENKIQVNNLFLTLGVLINIAYVKHAYLMNEGEYPLLISLLPLFVLAGCVLYNRKY